MNLTVGGATGASTVSNNTGTTTVACANAAVATATYAKPTVTVTPVGAGTTTCTVTDTVNGAAPITVTVAASTTTPISSTGNAPSTYTASNPTTSFTAVSAAGASPVTVNSPPVIRFTVIDSAGNAVTKLTKSSVRFAMAQLIPAAELCTLYGGAYDAQNGCVGGTNSGNETDQWVNFKHNLAKATAGTVAAFPTPAHAQDWQATTESPLADDSSNCASAATLVGSGCLHYDATNHYYVYYMVTDVKAATLPGPLGTTTTTTFWNPADVHRVAIQLSYTDSNGQTALVNPWYDFVTDASGNAVAADPAKGHDVANIASCNSCHSKLALHGGGRVDTHYCVMCHNSSTWDPYSGNNLDLRTMVHKIHAGRKLTQGYKIVGYQNSLSDFSAVGFPQDLRNCAKCHTGDATVAGRIDPATGGLDGTVAPVTTPQGENWKSKVSKAACLTCHDDTASTSPTHTMLSNATSPNNWYTIHKTFGTTTATSDKQCQSCHAVGANDGADVVHWAQALANRGNYQYNILTAATTKLPTLTDTGTVHVTFNIKNPGAGTYYNPLTDTRVSGLSLLLGYYNLATANALPEFTNYNNGGSASAKVNGTSSANVVVAGVSTSTPETVTCSADNSSCAVDIILPVNTATRTAQGQTAEVLMYGAVKEAQLDVTDKTRTALVGTGTVTIAAHPEAKAFAISTKSSTGVVTAGGTAVARRNIVGDDKCDSCHGVLDSASGSNTMATYPVAFHSGDRGTVKACTICHDVNRLSSGELQLGGTIGYNESFAMRRFIHGIHSAGAGFRAMPYLHGNGNSLTTDPNNTAVAFSNNDFAQVVGYPGALDNCTQCHVQNAAGNWAFTDDHGPLGILVNKYVTFDTVPSGTAGYSNHVSGSAANLIGYNATTATGGDPLLMNVISPQASVCSGCHDSIGAANHMINVGGGTFGTQIGATYPGNELGQVLAGGPANLSWDMNNGTQKSIVGSYGTLQGAVFEACDGCHGNTSGGKNGISGLKVQDVHTGLLYQKVD